MELSQDMDLPLQLMEPILLVIVILMARYMSVSMGFIIFVDMAMLLECYLKPVSVIDKDKGGERY